MELYQEILAQFFRHQNIQILLADLEFNAKEIVELQCYQALQQIKAILDDDRLDDAACFQRIEKIVCVFENMGSNGGMRHDFG